MLRTNFSAIPGLIIAMLIALTVSDPARDDRYKAVNMRPISDDENSNGIIDNHSKSSESENVTPQNSSSDQQITDDNQSELSNGFTSYVKKVGREFCSPAMMLLLLAATFRQCGGFSWAYNTKPYFQKYYPGFDISYWILACSIGGGSFGVFFGGFLSDRVVSNLFITRFYFYERNYNNTSRWSNLIFLRNNI